MPEIAAATSIRGPAVGSGSRLGTATRRRHTGCLDCSPAEAGAADRAQSATLRKRCCWALFGFRGYPGVHPRGLGRRSEGR